MIPKLETNDDFVQVDIPIVVSITVPKDGQYDLESYVSGLKEVVEMAINIENVDVFNETDDIKVTQVTSATDLHSILMGIVVEDLHEASERNLPSVVTDGHESAYNED